MILFIDDWKKHRHARPDYDTSNRSWVKLAGIYYKMGIKNCVFHLALHNPKLKGVDPHDSHLSEVNKLAIVVECKENPWYLLREVIRVPAGSVVGGVGLRGNRGNIALYWLYFNHILTLLIQPRQTGKSVSVDSLLVCLVTVLCVNAKINILTKDDSLRVTNIKRIKNILSLLPDYINLTGKKDPNNTEKVEITRLGNLITTTVAQASKKAALGIGRGDTITTNVIDELAFIKNLMITLPALLASGGAARDSAKEAGAHYGTLFTTTAGYLNSDTGKYAYGIYNESFQWTEQLFDAKDEEDLRDIITRNSPGNLCQVTLDMNHRQLGYTDDWLRGKIADAKATGDAVAADYLGIWPAGTESSPIHKDILKVIRNSVMDNITQIGTHGYVIRWYVSEDEITDKLSTRTIVGSLDTSDASGGDDIGLTFLDATTGEVLGAGEYNETNLITFSEWLVSLLINYPNLTFVIERRSSAVAIIDYIIKMLLANNMDPFRRLFNWVVNDAGSNEKYRREVTDVPLARRCPTVYEKYKKKFGYATSGSGRASRDNLYTDAFLAATKYLGGVVRDRTLINQLSGLVIKNNRIDHTTTSKDDLVISWLLGYWFLSPATDNKAFYGIDPHSVLTTVIDAKVLADGGSEAISKREEQMVIKKTIDGIVNQLRNEKNSIIQRKLLNRLMFIYDDIDTSIIKSFNLDEVLSTIKLNRDISKRAFIPRR